MLAHSMGARLIFSSLEKLEPYLVLAEKKRGSVKNFGDRQQIQTRHLSLFRRVDQWIAFLSCSRPSQARAPESAAPPQPAAGS